MAIPSDSRLTTGERQVLECILRGESNKEIAVRLSRSVKTVEFHVSNIFKKLRVTSRMQLLVQFVVPSTLRIED